MPALRTRAEPLKPAEIGRAVGRKLGARLALRGLRRSGLLISDPAGGVRLTPSGLTAAAGVVRSHRLWERFLADRLGLPIDHLHDPSHRTEHFISTQLQHALASELGADAASTDPHGKPIP